MICPLVIFDMRVIVLHLSAKWMIPFHLQYILSFQYPLLTAYWVLTRWELSNCDTLLFYVHIHSKDSLNKFFHFLNF